MARGEYCPICGEPVGPDGRCHFCGLSVSDGPPPDGAPTPVLKRRRPRRTEAAPAGEGRPVGASIFDPPAGTARIGPRTSSEEEGVFLPKCRTCGRPLEPEEMPDRECRRCLDRRAVAAEGRPREERVGTAAFIAGGLGALVACGAIAYLMMETLLRGFAAGELVRAFFVLVALWGAIDKARGRPWADGASWVAALVVPITAYHKLRTGMLLGDLPAAALWMGGAACSLLCAFAARIRRAPSPRRISFTAVLVSVSMLGAAVLAGMKLVSGLGAGTAVGIRVFSFGLASAASVGAAVLALARPSPRLWLGLFAAAVAAFLPLWATAIGGLFGLGEAGFLPVAGLEVLAGVDLLLPSALEAPVWFKAALGAGSVGSIVLGLASARRHGLLGGFAASWGILWAGGIASALIGRT